LVDEHALIDTAELGIFRGNEVRALAAMPEPEAMLII
jgi:hypothetical protein